MENSEELHELKVKVENPVSNEEEGKELTPKATAEKAKWSNDIEFLCSCITLSVGLGNVWR